MKNHRISTVIPCMNESKSIGPLIDSIKKELNNYDYEIIVVDKSVDNTAIVAKKHGAKVFKQDTVGYGSAIVQGFKLARGDILVMMDGDSTYTAIDLPQVIKPLLDDDADFVVGDRFNLIDSDAMTPLNKVGNKMLTFIANILFGTNVGDTQCGLRALTKKAFDVMNFYEHHMPFAMEMIFQAKINNLRIKQVGVHYKKRAGNTKLSPLRDGLGILIASIRMVRDYNPLLLFSLIGLLMLIFGAFLAFEVFDLFQRTGIVFIGRALLSIFLSLGGMFSISTGLILDSLKNYLLEKKL